MKKPVHMQRTKATVALLVFLALPGLVIAQTWFLGASSAEADYFQSLSTKMARNPDKREAILDAVEGAGGVLSLEAEARLLNAAREALND